MLIIQARFIARQTRQGWKRLCGEGAEVFFASALWAPGGRNRSAGHAKTDAPKSHLSGQPGSRLMNTPQREQGETMRHV